MSKSIKLKDNNNNEIYPYPYYPIGSIYLSVLDTNPSTFFGGTWEQIAKGRTLVGVDSTDADFNTVKKIGGSKHLQAHTHHKDVIAAEYSNLSYGLDRAFFSGTTYNQYSIPRDSGAVSSDVITGNSGNLQPYFTCYIWCRTA